MGLLLRVMAILLLAVSFVMNLMLEDSKSTFPAYVVGAIGVVIGLGAIAHGFLVQKNVQTTEKLKKSFGRAVKFAVAAMGCFGLAVFLGLSFISLPLVMLSVVLAVLAAISLVSALFTSN